jgi:hypothetical protein
MPRDGPADKRKPRLERASKKLLAGFFESMIATGLVDPTGKSDQELRDEFDRCLKAVLANETLYYTDDYSRDLLRQARLFRRRRANPSSAYRPAPTHLTGLAALTLTEARLDESMEAQQVIGHGQTVPFSGDTDLLLLRRSDEKVHPLGSAKSLCNLPIGSLSQDPVERDHLGHTLLSTSNHTGNDFWRPVARATLGLNPTFPKFKGDSPQGASSRPQSLNQDYCRLLASIWNQALSPQVVSER